MAEPSYIVQPELREDSIGIAVLSEQEARICSYHGVSDFLDGGPEVAVAGTWAGAAGFGVGAAVSGNIWGGGIGFALGVGATVADFVAFKKAERIERRHWQNPDLRIMSGRALLHHSLAVDEVYDLRRFKGLAGMPAAPRDGQPVDPWTAVRKMLTDLDARRLGWRETDPVRSRFIHAAWAPLSTIAMGQTFLGPSTPEAAAADGTPDQAAISTAPSTPDRTPVLPLSPEQRAGQEQQIAESLVVVGDLFLTHFANLVGREVVRHMCEQPGAESRALVDVTIEWDSLPMAPSYATISEMRQTIDDRKER